jgi:hypothetical protein
MIEKEVELGSKPNGNLFFVDLEVVRKSSDFASRDSAGSN